MKSKRSRTPAYALLALSAFLFFIPVLWADEFYLNVIISIYLHIILAVSLNMVIKTGKLSIAHAAFMGIGGYTSALTVMRLGLPYLMALPLSGLMGAFIALLVGRLLLKLQGVYFVLVTFAFGEVVRLFFVNLVDPFGGPTVIINIYLHIILAVSLNMVIKTGKLSIAHAAFMGIGGYTSALTVMRLGLPYLLALPLSGLMGAFIALLVGRLLLKLQGVYFVLVTFAFGEVVRLFFVNLVEPFGGPTGIINIPPPRITLFPGTAFTLLSKVSYYYLVLGVMLVTLFLIHRIYQSSIGKAMDCTRETEHLAEFTGIDTFQQKTFAFAAGGFFAGLAGSLFAHYYRFISPESFTFWESVNLIVINVVGGMGGIAGPILGSIFLVPLPEFLRGFVEYQRVLYGLILILTLWFMPAGMLGVLSKALDRMKARKTGREGNP